MASCFVYGDGVEVIGKRLSGQRAVVRKASSEEQVQVQLADGKVETVRAGELRRIAFRPVECVEAFGLTSEGGRGLNGKIGIVTCFVPESGRFEVAFPHSKVNLRAENLRKPTAKALSPEALLAAKVAEAAKAAAAKAVEEAAAAAAAARSSAPPRRMRSKGLPSEVAAAAAEAARKAEQVRAAEAAAEAARKAGEERTDSISAEAAVLEPLVEPKAKRGRKPSKAKAEQADQAAAPNSGSSSPEKPAPGLQAATPDAAAPLKAKRGLSAKTKAEEAPTPVPAPQMPPPAEAHEDGTPNKLPAKRRRQAEGKAPAPKRGRAAKAEAACVAEAEAKGLRGLLENLAARPAVAQKNLPMAKLLKALIDCDGLVNKAKDMLLA